MGAGEAEDGCISSSRHPNTYDSPLGRPGMTIQGAREIFPEGIPGCRSSCQAPCGTDVPTVTCLHFP